MIYNNQCDENIDEVNTLMNDLKIREDHANEIINIYFEFFDNISYLDFIKNEIRVLKKEDNKSIIKQLEDYEDACAFNGDDYVLITNYSTIKANLKNILGYD